MTSNHSTLRVNLEIVLGPKPRRGTLRTAAWVVTSAVDPERYPTRCVMMYGIITAPTTLVRAQAETHAKDRINTHNASNRDRPNVLQWHLLPTHSFAPTVQLAHRLLDHYAQVPVGRPFILSYAGLFGIPSTQNSICADII